MDTATGFTRRIDPIEWWFLGFPAKMSAALNLCVEGTGHVDPEDLRRAVAIASDACPGARLVRRGRTWVDSGTAPAVTVAHGLPADAPELRTPLPGRAGATCEVVLFPGPGPTVVFRAGHAVMDVRGLLWWARDVFRALRGEEPVGAASRATFQDLDDPLHRRAPGPGSDAEVPSLLGVPPQADLRRQLWRRRTIEGTVPALEARLAAALVEMSGHPVAPVGFVVDVRPAHPEIRSTGNLSLAVSLDLRSGDAWPDVDRQLSQALSERTCRVDAPGAEILKAPLLLLRHIVRRLDRGARREDRHGLLAEVYHLGRVRPEWFHTDGFTAAGGYALCPMEPGAALCVVATEGDGRTDLTLSWWDGPGMSERVDVLLDRLGTALVPQETG
jgi:hypothetical protein